MSGNQFMHIGSIRNIEAFRRHLQGHQIWSTQIGVPIPAGDEQNATITTGFGAGDGRSQHNPPSQMASRPAATFHLGPAMPSVLP